jgi:hypothetical protein
MLTSADAALGRHCRGEKDHSDSARDNSWARSRVRRTASRTRRASAAERNSSCAEEAASRAEERPAVSGARALGTAGCDVCVVLDLRSPSGPSDTFGAATGASRHSSTPCTPCEDAKPDAAANAATHAAIKAYFIAISIVRRWKCPGCNTLISRQERLHTHRAPGLRLAPSGCGLFLWSVPPWGRNARKGNGFREE